MKPFLLKSRTFELGQINSGEFKVFLAELPAPIFGTVSSLSMFSIIQPLFLIFIWDWDLNLNLGCKELEI